jgi:hypothetical protein
LLLFLLFLDFGNRPRKLYVVINPMSGSGSGSGFDKMWQKIQRMFQIANIHTDVLSEWRRGRAEE